MIQLFLSFNAKIFHFYDDIKFINIIFGGDNVRIQSGNSHLGFSLQNTKANLTSLVFKFDLEEQQKAIVEKKDEKTGKLVTSREGGYVRQYIVNSDGIKILVSEINTEQIISLLNYQATSLKRSL